MEFLYIWWPWTFLQTKFIRVLQLWALEGPIDLRNIRGKADFHPCFQVWNNCAPLLLYIILAIYISLQLDIGIKHKNIKYSPELFEFINYDPFLIFWCIFCKNLWKIEYENEDCFEACLSWITLKFNAFCWDKYYFSESSGCKVIENYDELKNSSLFFIWNCKTVKQS